MNIYAGGTGYSIFQGFRRGADLKCNQEKQRRMAERDNQLAALEDQKKNLKNMECGSLDEIEEKLKLFHSLEDQARAVKQKFNLEQVSHILDEARERGEKIAEDIEKTKPKTEAEREKEAKEEALEAISGEDMESDGMLEEVMEELEENLEETIEETIEENLEENLEKTTEENLEETVGENMEEVIGATVEETIEETVEGSLEAGIGENL